jgi:hypothetical protein
MLKLYKANLTKQDKFDLQFKYGCTEEQLRDVNYDGYVGDNRTYVTLYFDSNDMVVLDPVLEVIERYHHAMHRDDIIQDLYTYNHAGLLIDIRMYKLLDKLYNISSSKYIWNDLISSSSLSIAVIEEYFDILAESPLFLRELLKGDKIPLYILDNNFSKIRDKSAVFIYANLTEEFIMKHYNEIKISHIIAGDNYNYQLYMNLLKGGKLEDKLRLPKNKEEEG